MSDVVTSARTARERLAQGLSALQGPGVPDHLMQVAEPIARAMGALHRIEASSGQVVREVAPQALDFVRSALGLLQSQTVNHPSVEAALEAVAGSLGMVHQLVRVTSIPPAGGPAPVQSSPPMQVTAPVAPQIPVPPVAAYAQPSPAAAAIPFAATALAAGPAGFGATAPIAPPAAVAPAPVPTQPVPPQVVAQPMAPAQVAVAAMPDRVAPGAAYPSGAHVSGPESAFAPNSTLQSQGAERPPPGGRSPLLGAETQPEAKPIAAPTPGQLRFEAALGAHSPTNFYKGLSGNDVVDAGGLFVATYQIPRIGTPLQLKISLPGGYEFEAQAVVRWTRDPASATDGSSPGFGAQFTGISSEGRQLVYRYVRNREPLFHDDL